MALYMAYHEKNFCMKILFYIGKNILSGRADFLILGVFFILGHFLVGQSSYERLQNYHLDR